MWRRWSKNFIFKCYCNFQCWECSLMPAASVLSSSLGFHPISLWLLFQALNKLNPCQDRHFSKHFLLTFLSISQSTTLLLLQGIELVAGSTTSLRIPLGPPVAEKQTLLPQVFTVMGIWTCENSIVTLGWASKGSCSSFVLGAIRNFQLETGGWGTGNQRGKEIT